MDSEDEYKEDFQYEPQDIDDDYEDGTEEIEEIDEEAYLALIDKQSSPLQTCKQLLFPLLPFQSGLNLLNNEAITTFYQKGFAILNNILNQQEIEQIYSYTQRKFQENSLCKPHDSQKDHDTSARDDLHMWFSETNAEPPLAPAIERFSLLKEDLQQILKLRPLSEQQLAYYPPGVSARYVRHRDALPFDASNTSPEYNPRKVTAIIYSSLNWEPSDGGILRLYGDGFQNKEFTEVEPIPGRLVLFLSGAIDHEVCPVNANPRVALTTWFH